MTEPELENKAETAEMTETAEVYVDASGWHDGVTSVGNFLKNEGIVTETATGENRYWQLKPDGLIVVYNSDNPHTAAASGVIDEIRTWASTDRMRITEVMRLSIAQNARLGTARDPRICICGHPVGRHIGGETCSPTRMACWCREARPVLSCSDTRPFLRKTKTLKQHALSLGQSALDVKGRTWEWLPGQPTCMLCGALDAENLPLLIDIRTDKVVEVVNDAVSPSAVRDMMCCYDCCNKNWPDIAAELWRR